MEPYAGFEPQVGEIRALRTFRVGPGGTLYPLFSTTAWQDGPNTARCRVVQATDGMLPPHDAPDADCSCGFYAYGNELATGEYPYAQHVLAVVACWGRVIAGTRGIRAEHARIEAMWMSETVPVELATQVQFNYPSVEFFAEKSEMLAAHPPTHLDCYELRDPQQQTTVRRGLQAAVGATVAVTALPASWWDHISLGYVDLRVVWAAVLAFFVIGALVLARRRPADMGARRLRLQFQAVALWMVAPFAGPIGVLLLRVPLIQLTVLLWLQRRHLKQAAAKFPADIR